ncbi:hypothetical protein DAPPUDRAFT_246414 [Daphnia pulex]|uniref:Uncharacterized protein n=1 Tax=Daphnia pulex TaxID=6669 RepID=E9GQF7_DAPPU|nr:hypothetical protein DAPPUDRAFT_246414 [Daphnia pulex]|eukprot:EFX78345.1 hypothetical protein DAPPUDRAFT_246414 [Daphnia pulex]
MTVLTFSRKYSTGLIVSLRRDTHASLVFCRNAGKAVSTADGHVGQQNKRLPVIV